MRDRRAPLAWAFACQKLMEQGRDLPCKERRNCVSDLDILLGPIAEEQVVVGEGLQPSGLAHGQAPALHRIGMDEVMSILGDMARYGSRGRVGQLDSKTVIEDTAVPVPVIRAEREGKIGGLWAVAAHCSEHSREQVPSQIRGHVPARLVLGNGAQVRPLKPPQQFIVRGAIAIRQA